MINFNSVEKKIIGVIFSLVVTGLATLGVILFLLFQAISNPALFSAPFEFVPENETAVTAEGWPIYATGSTEYCLGETVSYSPIAKINSIPYVLNPNFTLVTAVDDSRFDVCHFDDLEAYPRNITRQFEGAITLNSVRDTSACTPAPAPGSYYIEAIVDARSAEPSAYLAGPFDLIMCSTP